MKYFWQRLDIAIKIGLIVFYAVYVIPTAYRQLKQQEAAFVNLKLYYKQRNEAIERDIQEMRKQLNNN